MGGPHIVPNRMSKLIKEQSYKLEMPTTDVQDPI